MTVNTIKIYITYTLNTITIYININYELRITNYELQITNYELQITLMDDPLVEAARRDTYIAVEILDGCGQVGLQSVEVLSLLNEHLRGKFHRELTIKN